MWHYAPPRTNSKKLKVKIFIYFVTHLFSVHVILIVFQQNNSITLKTEGLTLMHLAFRK